MNVIAIPYGPKWSTAALGFLFAAALCASSVWLVLDPHALAQSRIARTIGVGLATAMVVVGAAAAAFMSAAALYVLFIAVRRSRLIVLYDDHFVFPHGMLFASAAKIPYAAIASVKVEPLGTKSALRVRCRGSTLLIVESMLPSADHLQLLDSELTARAGIGASG